MPIISDREITEVTILLHDYYDALRREKQYAKADGWRTYLRQCGFIVNSEADGFTPIEPRHKEVFDNLRDRILRDSQNPS